MIPLIELSQFKKQCSKKEKEKEIEKEKEKG